MAYRALQRAACRWQPALLLGARAESTAAAAAAANAVESSSDAVHELVGPVEDPQLLRKLEEALAMPVQVSRQVDESSESERAQQLALLRLHNTSYNMHGQIIHAKVLDMDRKKILIDSGIKIAKIAHSDITSECIIGTTNPDDTPRGPGEVRVGDVVQVFLESVETPEGDMLVSGQQAAQERRFHAMWRELEQRMTQRRQVKGRILNQLSGGYAVGVAGLVCFLPAQACHPATAGRIGKLQDFWITSMNKGRQNVVLRDAQFSMLLNRQVRPSRPTDGMGRAAGVGPGSGMRQFKPRGQENPEQINQTAQELRALLAGKGRRPESS